jgi:hypothetical protein
MDERRPTYSLKAPGPSGSGPSMRLPGRDSFPSVDDHLVVPEVTRDEIIGGRRVVAHPAMESHGDQQTRLDYVLSAHVAPGYRGSSDLLTRHGVDSDFATDACVRKEGIDPATGRRHLEELAFEVVSEQNERDVTEKAPRMHRRGVRRIFALFVKGKRRVCEWEPESAGWRQLEPASRIDDPCLVKPLEVIALLDAAAADNAVVEALAAKGNPALRQREAVAKAEGKAEGLAEGEAKGRAEDVLRVLAARGIAVAPAQRQKILRCRDLDRLGRWLSRAAVASSVGDVLAEL